VLLLLNDEGGFGDVVVVMVLLWSALRCGLFVF
jgi:hypothetical protein